MYILSKALSLKLCSIRRMHRAAGHPTLFWVHSDFLGMKEGSANITVSDCLKCKFKSKLTKLKKNTVHISFLYLTLVIGCNICILKPFLELALWTSDQFWSQSWGIVNGYHVRLLGSALTLVVMIAMLTSKAFLKELWHAHLDPKETS